MATNRSETANFLVFNFYGWCKLSRPNQPGNHAPIEWVTEIEARKENWKFPDILLNDSTFMEGLHNTIKDALSGFANDTRVELVNLQKQINFEVHNSMEIFTKCIRQVRDYCSTKTKQRREKMKQDEAGLIQTLVNARTELNQDPENQTKIGMFRIWQRAATRHHAIWHTMGRPYANFL